jgi:UDP-glucose 4-epimerase
MIEDGVNGQITLRRPSCIVLGAGGFIGTNLCRRLVSTGAEVRAFGRRGMFAAELEDVEWYPGDFSDAEALTAAIESSDIVFHLVHGTTPYSASLDMRADLQENVVPSLALLDIVRSLGGKRVVFVSSGGTIYGPARQIPTPESAPTDPVAAYGISNLAIEKYLGLYEHLHGLDYRILRVANAFGPYQLPTKKRGIVAALISCALDSRSIEIWGDGSVVRDYVYADDVIDALEAAAADRSDMRIFNIGTGRGRSLRDVILAVQEHLDRTIDIVWRPGRSFDVPVSIMSIERARDMLGWRPNTAFEMGLRRTIAWWERMRRSGMVEDGGWTAHDPPA